MKRIVGFVIVAGVLAAASPAAVSRSTRTVHLRPGDVVLAAGLRCGFQVEAGVPELLCSRTPRARSPFDVAISRGSVAVYRMGDPDNPLFARRFP